MMEDLQIRILKVFFIIFAVMAVLGIIHRCSPECYNCTTYVVRTDTGDTIDIKKEEICDEDLVNPNTIYYYKKIDGVNVPTKEWMECVKK